MASAGENVVLWAKNAVSENWNFVTFCGSVGCGNGEILANLGGKSRLVTFSARMSVGEMSKCKKNAGFRDVSRFLFVILQEDTRLSSYGNGHFNGNI